MKSFAGQCQTTDTLCFPVNVIKKVLIAAEQKKVMDQQVVILNDRIAGYQSQIIIIHEKDSATVELYERQIKTAKEQRTIFEHEIIILNKQLRKGRRKQFFTALGGVAGIMAIGYLYVTK